MRWTNEHNPTENFGTIHEKQDTLLSQECFRSHNNLAWRRFRCQLEHFENFETFAQNLENFVPDKKAHQLLIFTGKTEFFGQENLQHSHKFEYNDETITISLSKRCYDESQLKNRNFFALSSILSL